MKRKLGISAAGVVSDCLSATVSANKYNFRAKISHMTQKIDAYRAVLSRFASGVTVVSAYRGEAMEGVTVSAFSALSLDPPLVLVCIGEASDCFELLRASEHFAVNVLAEHQASLALAFAETGHAKVQALAAFPQLWLAEKAPVLSDCAAHIVCRRQAVHPGGDHIIVVGEVLDLALREGAATPLVYFASEFRRLAPGT